jgi:Uma2 family endonuclease
MGVELVNGERFTSVEPTPLLAGCIAAAGMALAAAVRERFPDAEVAERRNWKFDPRTELTPSIVVCASGPVGADGNGNGGPAVPDLVVEFRTESTGRYVLGPKRMVYSRFRVPEFWYVDAMRRRVAVLRSEGQDYEWPPAARVEGDVLEPRRLPGVRVPVTAVVGSAFVPCAPADEDPTLWLES